MTGMELIAILTSGIAAFFLSRLAITIYDSLTMGFVNNSVKECKSISIDVDGVPGYMRLFGASLIIALAFAATIGKPLLGVVICLYLAILPGEIFDYHLKKRKRILKDQMIVAINLITTAVKSGANLETAFQLAADETPKPLGAEFRKIMSNYVNGGVFVEELESSKKDIQIHEYLIFVTTIITNSIKGGDLQTTLDAIKSSLAENRRLERKLESDTAAARLSLYALCATPAAFLMISYALNREGTVLLFSMIEGQIILLVASLFVIGGYKFGKKIMKVDF